MSKKNKEEKKNEPKRSFVDKVLGRKGEEKKEVKAEPFKESAPKPTGNPFKDAMAMSAFRSKQRQHNAKVKAQTRTEDERSVSKGVDVQPDRDETRQQREDNSNEG